jgi:WD40 repeat protein
VQAVLAALMLVTCSSTFLYAQAPLRADSADNNATISARASVDFETQIQPLFKQYCYGCHGPDDDGSGLRLHTSEDIDHAEVLTPGEPGKSQIYTRLILPKKDDGRMPKNSPPLTKDQTELIRRWIEQGALMPIGDHTLLGRSAIHDVFFLPGNDRLVTTADDGTVRLWNITTGQCERIWRVPAYFEPTQILAADLFTRAAPQTDDPMSQYVVAVGGNLATDASRKRFCVEFYTLEGARYVPTYNWAEPVQMLRFAGDGKTYLWHGAGGSLTLCMTGGLKYAPLDQATCAAFVPDGHSVAAAGFDNILRIRPFVLEPDGQPVVGDATIIKPLGVTLNDLAWSPSGDQVAGVTDDGTVTLYKVARDAVSRSIRDIEPAVKFERPKSSQQLAKTNDRRFRLSYSKNGKHLIVVGSECRAYDVDHNKELCQFQQHQARPLCGQLSSDGKLAASCDAAGDIFIWQTGDGKALKRIVTATPSVSRVWWNSDSRGIQWCNVGSRPTSAVDLSTLTLEAGDANKIRKPDSPLGLEVHGKELQRKWMDAIVSRQELSELVDDAGKHCFYDRSRLAAVPRNSSTIYVYDATQSGSSLDPSQIFHGHGKSVNDFAFSPDGQFLATCGGDGAIDIWNLRAVYDESQKDVVPWLTLVPRGKSIEVWRATWKESLPSRSASLIDFHPVKAGTPESQQAIQLLVHGVSPNQDYISYTDAIVRADLARSKPDDAKYQRYFSFAHLYFGGLWQREPVNFRDDLTLTLNSLSWAHDLVKPVSVDLAESIFRIDLRNLRPSTGNDVSWITWTASEWDQMASESPYRTPSLPEGDQLREGTGSERPWIRGDWFLSETLRPKRYIELLKLPETENRLKDRLRLSETRVRVGFAHSGVMKNNRMLERTSILGDGTLYSTDLDRYYWKSFDFANSIDRRNIFQHPSGPDGETSVTTDHFSNDAAEVVFALPNGMLAFTVFDQTGGRWDHPAADVTKPLSEDYPRSCIRCHGGSGIREAQDEIREYVETHREKYPPNVVDEIRRLHPIANELSRIFAADREKFNSSCKSINSHGFLEAPTLYDDPHSFSLEVREVSSAGTGTQRASETLNRNYDRSFVDLSLAAAAIEAGKPISTFRNLCEPYWGTIRGRYWSVRREPFEAVYQEIVNGSNSRQRTRTEDQPAIRPTNADVKLPEISSSVLTTSVIALLAVGAVCGFVARRMSAGYAAALRSISILMFIAALGFAASLTLRQPRNVVNSGSISSSSYPPNVVSTTTTAASTRAEGTGGDLSSFNYSLADRLNRVFSNNDYYDAILFETPKNAVDFAVMAWVHNEREEPDLAIEACDAAQSLDPELAPVWSERAYALLLKRDLPGANVAAERCAMSRYPDVENCKRWTSLHARVADLSRMAIGQSLRIFSDNHKKTVGYASLDLATITIVAKLSPNAWPLMRSVCFIGWSQDWADDKSSRKPSPEVVADYVELIQQLRNAPDASRITAHEAEAMIAKAYEYLRKAADENNDDQASAQCMLFVDLLAQLQPAAAAECHSPITHVTSQIRDNLVLLENGKKKGDLAKVDECAQRFSGLKARVQSMLPGAASSRSDLFEAICDAAFALRPSEQAWECINCAFELKSEMDTKLPRIESTLSAMADLSNGETRSIGYQKKIVDRLRQTAQTGTTEQKLQFLNALAALGQQSLEARYLAGAWRAYNEAEQVYLQLSTDTPGDRALKLDEASALEKVSEVGLQTIGKGDTALAAFSKSLEARSEPIANDATASDRINLLTATRRYGELAWQYRADLDCLKKALSKSVALTAEILKRADNTDNQIEASLTHEYVADFARKWNDTELAHSSAMQSVELATRLADSAPNSIERMQTLHQRLRWAARVDLSLGRIREARDMYERALLLSQEVARRAGADVAVRRKLADAQLTLATLAFHFGDSSAAEAALRDGLAIRERLLAENPWSRANVEGFAEALQEALPIAHHCNCIDCDKRCRQLQNIVAAQSSQISRQSPRERLSAVKSMQSIAIDTLSYRPRAADTEWISKSLQASDELASQCGEDVKIVQTRSELRNAIGMQIALAGDCDKAIQILKEANDAWEQERKKDPDFRIAVEEQTETLWRTAMINVQRGRFAEAAANVEAAAKLFETRRSMGLLPPAIERAELRAKLALNACLKLRAEGLSVDADQVPRPSDPISASLLAIDHASRGRATEAMNSLKLARQMTGDNSGPIVGEIGYYATQCVWLIGKGGTEENVHQEQRATWNEMRTFAISCLSNANATVTVDGFAFLDGAFYDCLRTASGYRDAIQNLDVSPR